MNTTTKHETRKGETMTAYRIQPAGCAIAGHRSETSNGNLDRGVHVCLTLDELRSAVHGWTLTEEPTELVTIECDDAAIADNGDYEGFVLVGNRGRIVARQRFGTADELRRWAQDE